MEFFDAIEKRHSYRGRFEDTPIPREHIVKILDAGIRAPSGCNQQTTSFLVVTDPAMKAKISEVLVKDTVLTAPLLLAVLTKTDPIPSGLVFELEDYGAAVENILLAVTALGYATVWLDGVTKLDGRGKLISEYLNVPDDLMLRCILPIGAPVSEGKQAPRKPFGERVYWEIF